MVGGPNWTSVSSIADSLAFAFDPTNPQLVYTPVCKSVDGGQTWTPIQTPIGARMEIDVDPVRHELYAVGAFGLYRSADGGTTWSALSVGFVPTSIVVSPDVLSPARPMRLAPAGPRVPRREIGRP